MAEHVEQQRSGSPAGQTGGYQDRWWIPRFWVGINVTGWWGLLWRNRFAVHPSRWGMAAILTMTSLLNSFLWLDPRREGLIRYQKIHLFRLMDEHRWLQPGNCPQIAPTPWGNAGLSICYDLRFPELFRSYALQGTDFFFLSAEWPAKRIHHWKVLTHARAIENLSFMFAVNCIGPTTRDDFGGCSMVVSPWGETLAEASPKDEDLLTVTVDIGQISRARNFLPVFQDRRPEIYPLNP